VRLSRKPGISVIMASYNSEATIVPAVESILRQKCTCPFELIVVDDGSTDASTLLIGRIQDERLSYIRLPSNQGRAAARHIAIGAAAYTIIAVADSDDISLPGRLQHHWNAFREHPGLVVSSGQLMDLGPDARPRTPEYRYPSNPSDIDAAFSGGVMGCAHPTSAFRYDWYEATGGYDSALRWCEDFDLFLRGWRPGLFVGSEEPLILYRRRSRRTTWAYWWENDRHHHAIVARHRGAHEPGSRVLDASSAFSVHLDRSSRAAQKAMSGVRFVRYRTLLLVKTIVGLNRPPRPTASSPGVKR
jgi:glycosyltransferase involved in cell wall biosynthesis